MGFMVFFKKTSINTTITYVARFMGCYGSSMGFLTGILATPRKMLNSKLENITKPCYHLGTTSKGFSPPCARHVSADQIKNKQTYIYIIRIVKHPNYMFVIIAYVIYKYMVFPFSGIFLGHFGDIPIK